MRIAVRYPNARWQVMDAVASLSDPDYQERIWIRREYPHPNFYDSFDQVVHTLFDDWTVLPDPRAAVGAILVDGPEVPRLADLGATLSRLIDRLGDVPDEHYLNHDDWQTVLTEAALALAAMVLAGSSSWTGSSPYVESELHIGQLAARGRQTSTRRPRIGAQRGGVTRPASCASRPAWVRLRQPIFTSIRDT